MYILGIWDGHDSGAAIIKDNQILVALNEERLTRRKLEINFPEQSIKECLHYVNLTPDKMNCVAVSSYDFSKTLARVFPYTPQGRAHFGAAMALDQRLLKVPPARSPSSAA